MLKYGQLNSFIVSEVLSNGYNLKLESNSEEFFMPESMAKHKLKEDDSIKAFVYLDPKGQTTCTTFIPMAIVGEYALLEVIANREFGAFCDWGLDKDLLVPGNEQKIKVQPGEKHVVRVCLEEDTNRVFGTTKLGKFIETEKPDLKENSSIHFIAANKTELGFRIIIEKKYIGMIYHSEIYSPIYIGEEYQGVVKKVREDNLVDISMQRLGVKNLKDAKDKILEHLQKSNGRSYLNDKSEPQIIKNHLGMSKKTFKSAIGMLYKEKKIAITDEGINLV